MDVSLLPRVLATACLDGGLAVIAGLLLASHWLGFADRPTTKPPERQTIAAALAATAALLILACCAHVYLLTAEFSGQSSWRGCLQQMPDMLSTHAGRLDAEIAVAAFALLFATLVPLGDTLRLSGVGLVLCAIVVLRSATGHAAVDGRFSLAELLQCVHLASMAVWSGAILVSGFYILPKLAGGDSFASSRGHDSPTASRRSSARFHAYLSRLSRVSTVAVTLVLLTGLLKSYRAVGLDVRLLRSATWGSVLLVKIVCVSLALGFGALNRVWLQRSTGWTQNAVRRSVTVLRLEAVCMLMVLLLSALLGNLSPPSTS